MRPSLLSLSLLFLASFASADVSLAPIFTDHAVIQRDQTVPVWGWADPDESITVSFADQSQSTVADSEGNWRIDLTPMAANSIGQSLTVTGNNTLTLEDLLIGDVWLCGGQSNMEWTVRNSNDADDEISAALYPQIRHIKVQKRIAADPQTDMSGEWTVCSPETAADYTAVGYFFARRLTLDLGVPIGLLNSTWGGTPVEAWLAPSAMADPDVLVAAQSHQAVAHAGTLNSFENYRQKLSEWAAGRDFAEEAEEAFDEPKPTVPWNPGPSRTTSVLYNGMIEPVIPYALAGFIWYQGEANANQPETYHTLFPALIENWREKFEGPELPFYWAQLASWAMTEEGKNYDDWAWLREAQHATLAVPHTGQAILTDVGEAFDIHPRNKQDVGDRLARIALAQNYDQDVAFRGPDYTSVTLRSGEAIVNLDYATGLTTRDGEAPRGFELADTEGDFVPATATIDGETVVLQAEGIESPRYVRYAWRRWVDANLQNDAGLPAEPFRTDGD